MKAEAVIAFLVGVGAVACGGAAESFETPSENRDSSRQEASQALGAEDAGGGSSTPEPASGGSHEEAGDSLGDEPTHDPCFEVSLPVLERWTSTGAQMTAAAAIWGFDLREGNDCRIQILADTSWKTRWGRTELVGDTAVVWINPEARIVEGPECSPDDGQVLLLSVLVHEFGHLAGLPHSDCDDCAMDDGHDPCEVLRPSTDELAAL